MNVLSNTDLIVVRWSLIITIAVSTFAGLILFLSLSRRRRKAPGPAPVRQSPARVLPISPILGIPFEEALETCALSRAMAEYAKCSVVSGLGLEPGNLLLQAFSISENHDTLSITYNLSEKGLSRYRSGTADFALDKTGKKLPTLRDSDTKEFLEQVRGKDVHFLKAAEVSALIVSAAHVISGMDVVRRLERVDKKMNLLLARPAIEQYAKLRKIYMMSRERLGGDLNDLNPILDYRGELLELRSERLEELRRSISNAPDPDKVMWINRKTKWGRKDREKKLHTELLGNIERLKHYRFATLLDLCLAQSTGTTHVFLEQTLPDELTQWSCVAEDLIALTHKITQPKLMEEAEALRRYIEEFTRFLQALSSGAPVELRELGPPGD